MTRSAVDSVTVGVGKREYRETGIRLGNLLEPLIASSTRGKGIEISGGLNYNSPFRLAG